MKNQKHNINHHYFDIIDTEHKAYWLGFLWADGSINKTTPKCKTKNRLTLAQKQSEKEHIQKFLTDLTSDYTIHTRQNTQICCVDINSTHMCNTLVKHGYGTKQERIHVPQIPQSLMHHFIRGYFDGDGCLSIYKQTRQQWTTYRQEWSITGQPNFINEIKQILETQANTTNSVRIKQYKKTNTVVSLRYGKKQDIEYLYAYLYHNATIYLETKRNQFQKYFSYHHPNGL